MAKKPRGKGYYAAALDMAIEESGLTMDEIERRCSERGRPVSSVYISRLRRGLMPPPSEEVSEALAAALGLNAKVLIMAGQLERTPDKVQELFIETVRRIAGLLALTEFILTLDRRAAPFLKALPQDTRNKGWKAYWVLKDAIAGGMLGTARDIGEFVFKLQEWLPEEMHTEEVFAQVRETWEQGQHGMTDTLEMLFQSIARDLGKKDPVMRGLSEVLGVDRAIDFNDPASLEAWRARHRSPERVADTGHTED